MNGFRMQQLMALTMSSSSEDIFKSFGPTPTQKFKDARYVALLDKETKTPFACHKQELRRQGKTQSRVITPNIPMGMIPVPASNPVMATV